MTTPIVHENRDERVMRHENYVRTDMTFTANGWVPTADVQAMLSAEAARMRTDEHPDRLYV